MRLFYTYLFFFFLILFTGCSSSKTIQIDIVVFGKTPKVSAELVSIMMPIDKGEVCNKPIIPLGSMMRWDNQAVQVLCESSTQMKMGVKLDKITNKRQNDLPEIKLDKKFNEEYKGNTDELFTKYKSENQGVKFLVYNSNEEYTNSLTLGGKTFKVYKEMDSLKLAIQEMLCLEDVKIVLLYNPILETSSVVLPEIPHSTQTGGKDLRSALLSICNENLSDDERVQKSEEVWSTYFEPTAYAKKIGTESGRVVKVYDNPSLGKAKEVLMEFAMSVTLRDIIIKDVKRNAVSGKVEQFEFSTVIQ